jgi:hypothetical protein
VFVDYLLPEWLTSHMTSVHHNPATQTNTLQQAKRSSYIGLQTMNALALRAAFLLTAVLVFSTCSGKKNDGLYAREMKLCYCICIYLG